MAEHTTLRLVAEHADACNLFDIPDGGATVLRKLEVLGRHCDELGRRYDTIEKTISTRFDPASRRARPPSAALRLDATALTTQSRPLVPVDTRRTRDARGRRRRARNEQA